MSDFTPTTAQVRAGYVRGLRNAFIASAGEHGAEFDRWLTGMLAAAWDRGHSHCFHVERPNPTPNPHRPAS